MSKNEIAITKTEVLPPELAPALQQGFSFVAECDHNARLSFAQGAAFMILAGMELLRLKKEMGVKRGRPIKGCNVATFNWKDTVAAHSGVSYDTCHRYMQMAEAVKSRLKKSDADLLLLAEQSASALDQADQQLLFKSVAKITDGHTAQQLMWDWGITKKHNQAKGGNLGGQATKISPEAAAWDFVGESIYQLSEASFDEDAWKRCWYELPLQDDEEARTVGLETLKNVLEDALHHANEALKNRRDDILKRIK